MIPQAEIVQGQVDVMRRLIAAVMGDVTPELAFRRPQGVNINPIATIYAHLLLDIDLAIGAASGGGPVIERDGWQGRIGIPTVGYFQTPEWTTAALNLDALHDYREQVLAAADAYLAGVTEEAAAREIDSPTGRATPALHLVAGTVAIHTASHLGEIAALKSTMGQQGLPF